MHYNLCFICQVLTSKTAKSSGLLYPCLNNTLSQCNVIKYRSPYLKVHLSCRFGLVTELPLPVSCPCKPD